MLNFLKNIWNEISMSYEEQRMRAEERYLNESLDNYDLEYRQIQLSKGFKPH
jgi:hypothetical protein